MKKFLKVFAATFLLSGFLVACADGEGDPEEPMDPNAPGEEVPGEDPAGDTGGEGGL